MGKEKRKGGGATTVEMESTRLLLFPCILLLLLLNNAFPCNASTDQNDVAALNVLFQSLNSPSQLQGWTANGGDPCGQSWRGVSCSHSRVTSVKLNGWGLTGTLGYNLEKLTSLTELDLSNNSIGSQIHYFLPPNVQILNLGQNQFSGQIPNSISQMTSLKSLNVAHNNLQGNLSVIFSQLSSLTTLDLSFNDLTGDLPQSFSALFSLNSLYLQNNQFTGSINVLALLPLQTLNVANNLFTGWIPYQLKKINTLSTDGNSWNSGPAPPLLPYTAPPPPPPPHKTLMYSPAKLAKILGSVIGGLVVLSIIVYIAVSTRSREEKQEEDFIDKVPGMPTRFTLQELEIATENFGKKLGEGGFGTVFEGSLEDERVAVKRLDGVGQGKKEFLAEVQIIGSIHHINLVRLIGFCAEKSKMLLVYEYMVNGSLDKWIYGADGRNRLNWRSQYNIITDIAKGLCYLHEECRQRIVHLDIKPENILLDDNFNAKVADFGLCKLIDRNKSKVMTRMRGTPGYLAPEWLTAMITEKVDVYSFGVVVMEILCGRRNLDYSQTEENRHLITLLEEKSKSNALSDLIDGSVEGIELHSEEVMRAMNLAMWCLQTDCSKRPSMSDVVKVLEGAMEIETSLDYNFVSSIPMITSIANTVDQSAPLIASVLSGPR